MKRMIFLLCVAKLSAMEYRVEVEPTPVQTRTFIINLLQKEPSFEDLSKAALALHMNKYSPVISRQIIKYLQARIEASDRSEEQRKYVLELRGMWDQRLEGRSSPQLENYLQEMINGSLEEAFRDKETRHQEELQQERWKFKAALLANAGTALGAATLTALITAVFR